MASYTIGVDFGTNTVRAVIVACADGAEVASGVCAYPSGEQGVILDKNNVHFARQNPADYIYGLEQAMTMSLAGAIHQVEGFKASQVIGIGIDSTGSTPLPVDRANEPLALHPAFKQRYDAHAWLWKDHTSADKAEKITRLARQYRPDYLAKSGDAYSSEWFWAKIWQCLDVAPDVFDAAYSWVELADFIPALLAGVKDPQKIRRGICAAGHKAIFSTKWGGLPDKEFLTMLHPKLAALRDRLYDVAYDASATSGTLCLEWAQKLGLTPGMPIAIGAFDCHYGSIGAGIAEGTLVKIIGTSTCDCMVAPLANKIRDIPGICGIVEGSIRPGFYGIEAGQSAVGDIFKWFVEGLLDGSSRTHEELMHEAAVLRPGESGLLALDWNNGNRTILVDALLSGLMLGQTLHTTRAHIYRALIEATAFGARIIIERIRDYGVAIDRVVACGGIAEKNPLAMQIYADVIGCPIHIAASSQTCALGAAIVAAVNAGASKGGHADFDAAQKCMAGVKSTVYLPAQENIATYHKIYALYRNLYESFGGTTTCSDMSKVMKELIRIKNEVTG